MARHCPTSSHRFDSNPRIRAPSRLRFNEAPLMTIYDLSIRYPHRATQWQLRTCTLALSRRPLLMGIVNVTPDSFSDGGRFFDPARAIDHALKLVEEGADLLD